MGPAGERFIAAAIAISTFGFLNLAVLAPSRVYYAMAADGVFFPALARLHPRFGTPGAAIILQSTWAILLALISSTNASIAKAYGELLNTVVFADWIFFGLTVAGLFVLRRRLGAQAGRPMLGYPIFPILFVAVAALVVIATLRETSPSRAIAGVGLLLLGIPVFYLFKWRSSRRAPQS